MCCVPYLEAVVFKAVHDLLKGLLLLMPEWKERLFWIVLDSLVGEFKSDVDAFVSEDGSSVGTVLWKSWLGWISQEALRTGGAVVRQITASKSLLAKLEKLDPEMEDTDLRHSKASDLRTVFPVELLQ
jgi:hypothetical protein